MFINCVSCGKVLSLPHTGSAEAIEKGIYDAIEAGWRYAPDHDDFACPDCKEYQDKLYESFAGKLRRSNKPKSYAKMIGRMMAFMEEMERE